MAHHEHAHEHAHGHEHSHELSPEEYVEAVHELRRAKDEAFQGPRSPLPRERRSAFKGLSYYPVVPEARVRARFVPHDEPPTLPMQTSTGEARDYLNIGQFEFEWRGERLALQVYWTEGAGSLFLPFRDKTSGKDTYGAGRYLDIEWEGPDAEYAVDFNLAYNPYCAYSEEFSCPFPPPQNWLQVPVEAGERNFEA